MQSLNPGDGDSPCFLSYMVRNSQKVAFPPSCIYIKKDCLQEICRKTAKQWPWTMSVNCANNFLRDFLRILAACARKMKSLWNSFATARAWKSMCFRLNFQSSLWDPRVRGWRWLRSARVIFSCGYLAPVASQEAELTERTLLPVSKRHHGVDGHHACTLFLGGWIQHSRDLPPGYVLLFVQVRNGGTPVSNSFGKNSDVTDTKARR